MVDVVELQDCFTINEALSRACASAGARDVAQFMTSAAAAYGGRVVVNQSGGLLSKGPFGATGLAQCAELVWQLRGRWRARGSDFTTTSAWAGPACSGSTSAWRSMRAVLFDHYGAADGLAWREASEPEPRRGEVLVRVAAVSLNLKDSFVRKGRFRRFTGERFPLRSGYAHDAPSAVHQGLVNHVDQSSLERTVRLAFPS